DGAVIADTPGFSSFDTESAELKKAEDLQYAFRDFAPYIEDCRFIGCSHVKEQGCAVIGAVREGKIEKTRHESYVRLYEKLKENKEWEMKKS
ncbi:MAG: ribosome small subunit-dependent GTPase A, partial [Oscillospiraceae bacterium]|nr:ribosome small subunit-dependent GTPase A [Oscillospiraceae bacterium]